MDFHHMCHNNKTCYFNILLFQNSKVTATGFEPATTHFMDEHAII